jgi:DNA polymerase II large subunit
MLLLDGLINFSRSYIPEKRGGLMDAPLVLSMRIDPNEIDKEAQNIDCLSQYPLEFYEASACFKWPKDLEKTMDTVGGRIGSPRQYEGIMFTHDTNDISEGPTISAYKTLGTMEDKMTAQLELGLRIRAVDEGDVAARVIETHFLPDLMGNLKSFSRQEIRCTKCSKKYRRIPLTGKCINVVKSPSGSQRCNNNLTMTVTEGAIRKYLGITKQITKKYNVNPYVTQRVLMTEIAIDSLFESPKVKKMSLDDFM